MGNEALNIVVKLQDEASQKLNELGGKFTDLSKRMEPAIGASKTFAAGLLGIGAAVGVFGVMAVKSASEAEVAMAAMDATLNTMVGTTQNVVTGHKNISVAVKGSADSVKDLKSKVEDATVALNGKTIELKKLNDQYKKGKISQEDFTQKTAEINLEMRKLTETVKDGTSAQVKYESKTVNTTKAVKITADTIDDVRKKILAASNAFVKLGLDDEAAAQGMALLYQRTGDVEQAIKLQTLAADLSRAKNIELSDATKLVAMALSGNGRALLQYGIDIKDSATPLEALAELQKKVGGQADAFSKTLAGQMQVARQEWDNFTQAVGEYFLPTLIKVMITINDFIANTLPGWIEKAKEITKWVGENTWVIYVVAGAITGALVPAVYAAVVAFGAWAVAIAPFLIGGAIIGGAIAGILLVVKNWDFVVMQIKAFGELLAFYWTQLWTGIGDTLKSIWQGIKDAVAEGANWVIAKVNAVIESLNSVARLGGSVFGMSSKVPQLSTIPKFADGGIVTGPTVGLIGEAGPEAVIPLSKMGNMGGTTIIINNPEFRSREDEDRMKRMLEQYFRPLLINNKI